MNVGDIQDEPGRGTPQERFIASRKEFFVTPESRVAFLTGALVQTVAYVQWKNRGDLDSASDAPFLKKTRGLRLNSGHLRRLLSEAKDKLMAYQVNNRSADTRYSRLQSALSQTWTETCGSWNLPADDTTFYFVLGMNLNPYMQASGGAEESKEKEGI